MHDLYIADTKGQRRAELGDSSLEISYLLFKENQLELIGQMEAPIIMETPEYAAGRGNFPREESKGMQYQLDNNASSYTCNFPIDAALLKTLIPIYQPPPNTPPPQARPRNPYINPYAQPNIYGQPYPSPYATYRDPIRSYQPLPLYQMPAPNQEYEHYQYSPTTKAFPRPYQGDVYSLSGMPLQVEPPPLQGYDPNPYRMSPTASMEHRPFAPEQYYRPSYPIQIPTPPVHNLCETPVISPGVTQYYTPNYTPTAPVEAKPVEKSIEESHEQVWSGFFTRSKQHRVGVDAYLISGNVVDLLTDYNLNISHRTALEDVPRISSTIHGIVAFTSQNGTQDLLFDNYIEYFASKQRVVNILTKLL